MAEAKGSTSKTKQSEHPSRKVSQDKVLTKRGYSIGGYLGEGSYSQVYVAEYSDPKKNANKKTKLAVKIVNTVELSKDFQEKFFPREMSILNEVRHPNIIRVHSILKRKQIYYIFMEFAENGDLLHFILTNGAIKEHQSRIWFIQILRGMKYLHDRNIVHRDMKCENLLLTTGFNIKISDFGFARYSSTYADGSPKLVETYCGSVTYVAPEILRGEPYDPKMADLWSLGIILYIMLNKAWPFDPTVPKKLYEAQMTKNFKIRSKIIDTITPEVKHFIKLLLEPEVRSRLTLDEMRNHSWFDSNLRLVKPSDAVGQEVADESLYSYNSERDWHQNDGNGQRGPGILTDSAIINSDHEPGVDSTTLYKNPNATKKVVVPDTMIAPRSKKEDGLDATSVHTTKSKH